MTGLFNSSSFPFVLPQMASTLLSPRNDQVSNPTTAFPMPDVFVVPPEEDKTPTWCCFNASEAPSHSANSDLPSLVDALSDLQSRSQALYDVAEPFGAPNTIIVSIPGLENAQTSHSHRVENEIEPDDFLSRSHYKSSPISSQVGNDSVVEVVKIGCNIPDEELHGRAEPPLKRSKSFRFRASRVFRSIKIVGRISSRSKQPGSDALPSNISEEKSATHDHECQNSRSKTPTMSRRKSAVLSQLFTSPATLGRSLASSVSASRSPPVNSHRDIIHTKSSPYCDDQTIPRPISPSFDVLTAAQSNPPPGDLEHDVRCASPSPSTRTLVGKRRFPITGLQRIFSLTSGTEHVSPSCAMPYNSSGPSNPTRLPNTQTDDKIPFPCHLQLDLEGMKKPLDILPNGSSPSSVSSLGANESVRLGFGMRLDSLHFDALSFDVNGF